ncbi:cellulose synthase-like protein E6 isoform X3 [Carex littledalei]|uniref:Cellulose synthase-like protein E6 isoform X3 n=1 Tax=Carex littledalei TaxID=544730 RepID=A0A833VNT1_9POAL|nr:cellulose synthase-like protein E6 isoform X3 [Carex littledalei]
MVHTFCLCHGRETNLQSDRGTNKRDYSTRLVEPTENVAYKTAHLIPIWNPGFNFENFRVTKMEFTLTTKVSGEDSLKRYEQEIIEFDASPLTMAIIVFVALLNLACLIGATSYAVMEGSAGVLEGYFLQILLSGLVVAVNVAIYEGLLLRKDKGNPNLTWNCDVGVSSIHCLKPHN